jgi:hypothetical protein
MMEDPRQVMRDGPVKMPYRISNRIDGQTNPGKWQPDRESWTDEQYAAWWNLTQEIAHAERRLEMINSMNGQLESKLHDWANLDVDLESLRSDNGPLRDRYIDLRESMEVQLMELVE